MQIVRSLNAELVFIRKPIPVGEKGMTMTPDGKTTPDGQDLERALATTGPALKPGDRARITNVRIEKSEIRFEINGGPKKKQKWYQHVQIGGAGGVITPGNPTAPPPGNNPHGTVVTLMFPHYIPEMTVQQLKQYLQPVLDFRSVSATEAYLDTLPPKAKEAIKNHQVLVGMDRDMVITALGRPPKKYRDRDEKGTPYEEWIYGEPPRDMQFVRFVGDQVVRLEIMKVGGEKLVKTEREIEIKQASVAPAEKPAEEPTRKIKRPTLRRPDEEPERPEPTPVGTDAPSIDPDKQDPTLGPQQRPPAAPVPNVPPPPSAPMSVPGQSPGQP